MTEPASWDTDTLPQGDEKKAAVREMFDAIAPRYDLANRIMTFRLDVRWRRKTVRDLALPAGATVLDLAAGTGDLCIDLREAGLVPISVDLSYGMLAAEPVGRTTSPGRHLEPAGPGRFRRRCHVRLRRATSSTSVPSTTSWPESFALADGSPCSTSGCRATRC
ncbi:MAG: class I SAM-dependent methyltransferase [Ilumatobacteraceae bacterium]